jgi:NADPH-dependent 2,4-dienoyl-CoA reductase/sulfur reductase-like enzyme/rhodanese-related sulfurtransferase
MEKIYLSNYIVMNMDKSANGVGEGRKVLIVGGVAGGASCAARLRRLDEQAAITIFERGEFVSFANCGLPYHVGDVIPNEDSLVLASPRLFLDRFRIDVRTGHEVVSIDRAAKSVLVRRRDTGEEFSEVYDYLVLSPGAVPLQPPIPGLDLPGVFTVRTIPDTRVIRGWIEAREAKRAVVAGGGFIGLEMAENLRHRGMEVTILELAPQVMPPMDPEMVRPLERHIEQHGIRLVLGDAVQSVERQSDGSLVVASKSGLRLGADLVISALGVRPEVTLAREAGLEIGGRGGIRVDEQMRTSDPAIFAVGDAVEVRDIVTGQEMLLALAGPANRQGRIAADVICGRKSRFRGVQGTAACGMFGMAAAATGASEKWLRRAGMEDFATVHLHPKNHVAYFPGAEMIHLKLVFRKSDGRILGAQAVGMSDVPRKIDTVAAMIQLGGTVYDLAEAELCYAPQYGAAKDALNFAGMIAVNLLQGDVQMADWSGSEVSEVYLLDVRDPAEFASGHVAGAVNIPLNEMRERVGEIPAGREIGVYCGVGQRGYYAARILEQHGRSVVNFSGGWLTYQDTTPR